MKKSPLWGLASLQCCSSGHLSFLRYSIIIVVLFSYSCNRNSNEKTKATLRDITETVYASAQVIPVSDYEPQTASTGIIKEIFVEEGDTVRQGQKLFHISTSPDLETALADAQLQLQDIQSDFKGRYNVLQDYEKDLLILQKKLKIDSINFIRQENLWSKNIGRKADYDQALLQFQTTKQEVKKIKNQIQQKRLDLKTQYEIALNRVKNQKNRKEDYTLLAEMDGLVYSVLKEEGEIISPNEVFGRIGSTDFIVAIDIDEVDITQVQVRDTVVLHLDAYPDQAFLALIQRIQPQKDDRTRTFRAECQFIEKPDRLYPGLSAEANVIIGRKKKALVIPSDYVIEDNTVMTSDGPKRISIGIKNLEFVEVLSGIDSSTVIFKSQ